MARNSARQDEATYDDENQAAQSDEQARKEARIRKAQAAREKKQRRREVARQRAAEAAEQQPPLDQPDDEQAQQQQPLRTWKDDTGKFSIVARFVEFTDDKVRLKRANGRVVSVPLQRLSKADQDRVLELVTSAEEAAS